jgi:hypothetical protein
MNHIKYALILMTALVLLTSCTGQINGVLREDGSADVTVQTNLQPAMAALAFSFSEADRLLDAASITKSLSASRGIKSAAFRSITGSSLVGTIDISNVNEFLSNTAIQDRRFVKFEQNGKTGKLEITLDRSFSPDLFALLSPDLPEYLSVLLMSPAAEEQWQYITTKADYLTELKTYYRNILPRDKKKMADDLVAEIKAAQIHLAIDFPKPVRSVQGGRFSGKRAEFDIPLLDLLVLETPMRYVAEW